MKIDGRAYRAIWPTAGGDAIETIDQTLLPHHFTTRRIDTLEAAAQAITTMVVRGAPLIGATAAFGLALALRRGAGDAVLEASYRTLAATRPTAVNLRHALDDVSAVVAPLPPSERAAAAWAERRLITWPPRESAGWCWRTAAKSS